YLLDDATHGPSLHLTKQLTNLHRAVLGDAGSVAHQQLFYVVDRGLGENLSHVYAVVVASVHLADQKVASQHHATDVLEHAFSVNQLGVGKAIGAAETRQHGKELHEAHSIFPLISEETRSG